MTKFVITHPQNTRKTETENRLGPIHPLGRRVNPLFLPLRGLGPITSMGLRYARVRTGVASW